jgi:hypothetical protein
MTEIEVSRGVEGWEADVELSCLDIPIELLEKKLECASAAEISSPDGQFWVGLLCGRLLERGQIRLEFP